MDFFENKLSRTLCKIDRQDLAVTPPEDQVIFPQQIVQVFEVQHELIQSYCGFLHRWNLTSVLKLLLQC